MSLVNSYETGGEVKSSPAIANGYVYIGSFDGKVYQLNATNISKKFAEFETLDQIWPSPSVNGKYVYIGSGDNKFYQLNATNISKKIGEYSTGNDIESSPTILDDYVYIGSGDGDVYRFGNDEFASPPDNYPTVSLNSPNDGNITNLTTINFNCSVTDDNGLANLTLIIWNSSGNITYSNTTDVSGISNESVWTISNFDDGVYTWDCEAYDNSSQLTMAPKNYTLTVDTTYPKIDFVNPTTSAGKIFSEDILANISVVDLSLDTITVNLYNSDNSLYQSSSDSSTPFYKNFSDLPEGVYYLNASAEDSLGRINYTETRIINLKEPGIPVTGCQDLNVSGGYYRLKEDIINHSGDCFTISADGITLDCENVSTYHLIDGAGIGDNSAAAGIDIHRESVKLKNCRFTDWQYAFYDGGSSGDIYFYNNTVRDGGNGIDFYQTDTFGIVNNTFKNMTNALSMWEVNNGKIYNNIFNGTNITISGNLIRWNTTKTEGTNVIGGANLGGNYWTNETGGGFSDRCLDNDADGICDSWYAIPGNISEIDYLPLASGNTTNEYNGTGAGIGNCRDIDEAGIFYLYNDIINHSGDCFMIKASEVILDLNSKIVDGVDDGGDAIIISNYVSNVTIKDGKLTDWQYVVYDNTDTILNISVINNSMKSSIYGIDFFTAIDFNIINNTFENLSYGLYLVSSESGLIYNNIFNTSNNVELNSVSGTYWNTTKTGGPNIIGGNNISGNLWTNSTGSYSDRCTDADSDGVCDSPVNVSSESSCTIGEDCGDNTDYSPLSLVTGQGRPKINLDLIYPQTDISVNQNQMFNVSVNVTCKEGSCGEVNVSLVFNSSGYELISTSSSTPFWTNNSNPRNISLSQDSSQEVKFWINATGDLNSHEFYIYANDTSDMSISNSTDKWNVSIVNSPPEVRWVSNISKKTPVEESSLSIDFTTTIYDVNGGGDINTSSVMANFSIGGGYRENLTCLEIVGENTTKTRNFSCSIKMWYWDNPGVWNISVYGEDNSKSSGINKTTHFNYTVLKAVKVSPVSLTWSTISPGGENETANQYTTINNTGNYNGTGKVAIKALNLHGDDLAEKFIGVGNISVGLSTGGGNPECAGTLLQNGSDTTITSSLLEPGNLSSGNGKEELYYCITKVPYISSQTYSTSNSGSWEIKVL
jgi:hypothetical protein